MVSTVEEPTSMITAETASSDDKNEIKAMKESIENEEDKTEKKDEGDKENGESVAPEALDEASSSVADEKDEQNGKKKTDDEKKGVECIELEDDDCNIVDSKSEGEPPSKKSKIEEQDKSSSKSSEKKEPELNSPEALLNKLEEYISDAINSEKNVKRKVLDALLGAINVQVQREPLSVRKLILDKQLVLPNTISFPPSQVVDMLIEHDPEYPLSKVINKMFGDERPKLSDAEKKERHTLKGNNPAPHMTKLLMDIGQDLVQEATYCDIVHAKNLPETPKNLETYKTVAAQLKPVWETLKKKNEPYKPKLHECLVCGFKTESRMILNDHKARTHYKNGKYMCALCPEFDTNETRLISHYLNAHCVVASREDTPAKYPCVICEEDFQLKGLRDQHLKSCKKDYTKVRQIMAPTSADVLMINQWLWDRPPVDPTILQQQQVAQAHQKKAQIQSVAAQAAMRRNMTGTNTQNAAAAQALIQQQFAQRHQQQLRQLGALMNQKNSPFNNNNLIAAMQQHIQRAAAQSNTNNIRTATPAAASPALNKASAKMSTASLLAQAQALRKFPALTSQAMKMLTSAAAGLLGAAASSPQSQNAAAAVAAAAAAGVTTSASTGSTCEICDQSISDKEKYLQHLQVHHKQMRGKVASDMSQGAPLACSRCKERFWTYEGLERHLVMSHGLVTADLLQKAQKKEDGGRCKLCGKQYAFNMLQHLVADHQVKLCSAEIMYSCDVCSFKCTSYKDLETHLSTQHPKNGEVTKEATKATGTDCITLDD
ncbi:unnamed protein product [Auanema sp. JU1783]|nr:unnamed protein product [Auanema sp. JU1783]